MSEVSALPETLEEPTTTTTLTTKITSVGETPTENNKPWTKSNSSEENSGQVANDLQRAIDGLKDIPDADFQELFNDEDFMKGLDVVDAWEGDEQDKEKKLEKLDSSDQRQSSHTSNKERDSHAKLPRARPRRGDRKHSPYARDRLRRDERKRDERDEARRDPNKSSKDIERDKIRTKKDTDSKILAEKEKAIKYILDSDDVVPPGTEVEAIQDLTDKQLQRHQKPNRNRERRRSQERSRASPSYRRSDSQERSARSSPHRRSSQERRRHAATPPNLRRSWERRSSRDRSLERTRRREERELRVGASRRSRSRERHRSRSLERHRSRSVERHRSRSPERHRRRWSRSPVRSRRSSPKRHSRSRSPERRAARKRSPFINEIARQFRNEGLFSTGPSPGFLPGIPPLMNPGFPHEQPSTPGPPPPMSQFVHHHPAPPSNHFGNHHFGSFEQMNFEPVPPPQPDYAAGPIMYNPAQGVMQPPILGTVSIGTMHSPQPVPPPRPLNVTSSMKFGNQTTRCIVTIPMDGPPLRSHTDTIPSRSPTPPRRAYKETASKSTHSYESRRTERLKTPEPPIISNSKPFEKTSLSSLLEASVTAKDSHGPPVLYPGFKPEIMRHCELALRDLPDEDLRLKRKGRFFFDPNKECHTESDNQTSNSILLRTSKNKIYWEKADKLLNEPLLKPVVETHQKICQTDELETESVGVQVSVKPVVSDFCQQVNPYDLQQASKEEKRPIMDRLDWTVREEVRFDYPSKIREADDLRWSLSNSSQKRPWSAIRQSPDRGGDLEEEREPSPAIHASSVDRGSRSINNYAFDRSTSRDHQYSHSQSHSRSRDRFSPSYGGSLDLHHHETFHENDRSDRSRGESPMLIEDSPDEIEILDEERFGPRTSDWRKSSFGGSSSSGLHKSRSSTRGKTPSKPYRGGARSGGAFRGKY